MLCWVCVGVFRLEHEVNVLQQQLSESRRLAHALRCDLQLHQSLHGTTQNDSEGKPYEYPALIIYNLDPDCAIMFDMLSHFHSLHSFKYFKFIL